MFVQNFIKLSATVNELS